MQDRKSRVQESYRACRSIAGMPIRIILFLLLFALLARTGHAQGSSIAVFGRPFTAEYPLGNWHDHQSPREFVDANGFILNSEGRQCGEYIDGHEGYDWVMPEGTPIFAVSDGQIYFAGVQQPVYCPLLGADVAGNIVILSTSISNETFYVDYLHFSSIVVTSGQSVKRGDLLGYSGNTGCSSLPHLHFAIYRPANNGSDFAAVDPYGWSGSTADPWASDPAGAASIYLWDSAAEPSRFFLDSVAANDCEGCRSPVPITKVRWMGPNDSANPNNEFVELSVDARFGPKKVKLDGYKLKNNKGNKYRIRTTYTSRENVPVSVFTGRGKTTKKQIFLNQRDGIWDDFGDCVRLYDKRGNLIYYFIVGNGACVGVS